MAGKKAIDMGLTDAKDFSSKQYLIFERLDDEHLSWVIAFYVIPDNSQDPLGKLTEEERLWKFYRTEFRPNQP